MAYTNYQLFISKIHRLNVQSRAQQKVKITFTGNPSPAEWEELRKSMNNFLKEGYKRFEFNLRRLKMATSSDLGMWVACNASVSNYSGSIQFVACSNSHVENLIHITKLDSILSIKIV